MSKFWASDLIEIKSILVYCARPDWSHAVCGHDLRRAAHDAGV